MGVDVGVGVGRRVGVGVGVGKGVRVGIAVAPGAPARIAVGVGSDAGVTVGPDVAGGVGVGARAEERSGVGGEVAVTAAHVAAISMSREAKILASTCFRGIVAAFYRSSMAQSSYSSFSAPLTLRGEHGSPAGG